MMGKAPVVGQRHLKELLEGSFMLDSQRWIVCPTDLSQNAFALSIKDSAVTAAAGRSCPKGVSWFQ